MVALGSARELHVANGRLGLRARGLHDPGARGRVRRAEPTDDEALRRARVAPEHEEELLLD
eukprot:2571037-Lingulodinium_polyedra.AAC.1